MSKPSLSRSHLGSSTSSMHSDTTAGSNGRFFRPVPYATTIALQQFFDGGSIEQHVTRRTTSSAQPTSTSTSRSSRRNSAHPAMQGANGQSKDKRPRQKPIAELNFQAGELSAADRAVGKGASLPVVDENGNVWFDWEEKQEFTRLITPAPEDRNVGWVAFKGANNGYSSDEGVSDDEPPTPGSETFAYRAHLEAFSFPNDPSRTISLVDNPSVPRPRGKDRIRRVRADSLPSSPTTPRPNISDVGRREFLESSFDPTKDFHKQSGAALLLSKKRASISMKGFAKKLLGKKTSST